MIIALAALTMLCLPAFGQTTAGEWFDKGVAFMNQNKYNEALQAFDKAIELDPQRVDALRNMGAILNCMGKYDEAFQILNRIIEIDPQDAVAWANKGLSFYGKSDYDGAVQR